MEEEKEEDGSLERANNEEDAKAKEGKKKKSGDVTEFQITLSFRVTSANQVEVRAAPGPKE